MTKLSQPETNHALPRVRMLDIARRAGVSRSLVSHVLADGGGKKIRVSAKTADKIRRIATQLNFHPNHAAQQLAGKASGIVAALAGQWLDQTQLRLMSWLNEFARRRGLEVLAGEVDEKLTFEQYVEKCLGWNVDGLIFVALQNDAVWPEAAHALARLPRVVSVVGNPSIPGSCCVESDVASGVREAVEHLHQQGRRKIVQVLTDVDTQLNVRRHRAFLDAHAALGRPVTADLLCLGTAGFDAVAHPDDMARYAALCNEIIDTRRPDAILAPQDFAAAEFLRTLRRRGIRVPDDVAVIGWGKEQLVNWTDPPLTTVSYELREVAEAAFEVLCGVMAEGNGFEKPVRDTITVPCRLIVRETG